MTNNWKKEFCERYKDFPPGVLAMMITDIDEFIAEARTEERERILKEHIHEFVPYPANEITNIIYCKTCGLIKD